MGARWKHFKTVCKHKLAVYKQCKACGIAWQGIKHDLSKFSRTEFSSSAKYFQGNRSPIEAEKEDRGYSLAWLHHKGHNPHHWEYWTDFDSTTGEIICNRIPYRYVVEMMCDWIGAGMVYSQDKWTQQTPYEYYLKVRDGRHFNPVTEELILKFLECIRDKGLEEFHRMARCDQIYAYLAIDYEGIYCP